MKPEETPVNQLSPNPVTPLTPNPTEAVSTPMVANATEELVIQQTPSTPEQSFNKQEVVSVGSLDQKIETPTIAEPQTPIPNIVVNSKDNVPGGKKTPLQMVSALPKNIKILGGMVVFLIVLLLLTSFTTGGRRVREQITQLVLPTGTPIPTTAPVGDNFPRSPYFSDPMVTSLEDELKKFDEKINGIRLRDESTRIPSLDWDVNFKQ